MSNKSPKKTNQSKLVTKAARELESDVDERRWEKRLKKIADKKPDDKGK